MPVLQEDEVLLGVVQAGDRVGGMSSTGFEPAVLAGTIAARARNREARPLHSGALGARGVQVLPLVGEPPVVVEAEAAVEIHGA